MLMRLLFLPVLTAAILIGGATVVLPQVAAQVVVPQVVLPQVVLPPWTVDPPVPYPAFGGFYGDNRRDVYAYGHRGHESRAAVHYGGGGHGGRR